MSNNISFEFFPPNTDVGASKLRQTRQALTQANPAYFSVTYGAGGANQEKTINTVLEMADDGLNVAPHVSCIGSTEQAVDQLLQRYRDAGVNRIVALRGDLPSGSGPSHGGAFRYASDLVAFIRRQHGDFFHIKVAAYPETHPQAASPHADMKAFVTKANAGANEAITQYFFNADAYFRFRDEAVANGATIPIVPGIMPITNHVRLARFSDACGAEIPRWIRLQLEAYGDDIESIRSFGHDVVAQLCERLILGGVPGIHFYTLNQSAPALALCKTLPDFHS